MNKQGVTRIARCTHCGEACSNQSIRLEDHVFCCEGCKMVYQLLNQNGFCDYYALNETPGQSQRRSIRADKFSFLDDLKIRQQLISYADDLQSHVTFYLPQMHCSSCLYLLENLHRLNTAITASHVNFTRKEAAIVFNHKEVSLRQVAELLTSIGYEPYISLNDLNHHKPSVPRKLVYQVGIAGFCFANIMLLSFPEYLGLEKSEAGLANVFRLFNLILALPVFFYCALPFFTSGFKALRHGFLNIDAPISLAIIVTFIRSVYEISTDTGAGYLDSMAGIVFFMLIGRFLQEKTYQHLSFERDFTSYFPIAITVIKKDGEVPTTLPDIRNGDTLRIHSEELIPTDGIITRGQACIDYSFVTGESVPVVKEMGEIVYAGGKQIGGVIEVLVIKEVSQGYLTKLWSGDDLNQQEKQKDQSFVHLVSKYFTYVVLSIAIGAALYWSVYDPSKIWDALTAVLIVACPCALLLSNTFTNGHILNILSRKKLYLRNAQVIETIARTTHIVFDKTGTLTDSSQNDVEYIGKPLNSVQLKAVSALASQSTHPLSKAIHIYIGNQELPPVQCFREIAGKGIEGFVEAELYALGSKEFLKSAIHLPEMGSVVYIAIENEVFGKFVIRNHYRESIPSLLKSLGRKFKLSVISGDHDQEKTNLAQILGPRNRALFNQSPADKLNYVKQLADQGETVLMIGDGLNDAGALKNSATGIALTEDSNNFTPASDGILEARSLGMLEGIIQLCVSNRKVIIASFIISIIYNIIGIGFAVQGLLSPLIAAVLMPASSITIMAFTFAASNLFARWYRVK